MLSDARAWIRRSQRGRVLLAMFLLLVPAFALTAFTTRAYRLEQQRLAAESSEQGERALREGRPDEAVTDLRTAMSLAPTRARRLRLAQALGAARRDAEARAHLLTLRDSKPGDGVINLELARLAARADAAPVAARYYRDAIDGAWATAPDMHRRKARLELANLLVRHGTAAQAEAELIALAADLPSDAALHVQVGGLMMQVQQMRRAFDLYGAALRLDPANPRAMQGAGEAAYRLGNYITARRYFSAVADAEPGNTHVAGRLETINAVLALNPFRRGLAARERARRAVLALEIASKRLAACAEAQGVSLTDTGGADDLQRLAGEAQAIAPRVQVRTVSRDPDLLDELMDLVFRLEDASEARCGEAAHGADQALMLIAQERRATER